MQQFRVIIPEEKYFVLEFIQEEHFGIALINAPLKEFEPKEVFGWHFSLIIQLEILVENGMPSKMEQLFIEEFENHLRTEIMEKDPEKPNGLFLARITWNKTREIIYRVNNPELVDRYLNDFSDNYTFQREFDYRIDFDKDWNLASWHLGHT